jgi:Tfp pilus assembly protein PilW
MMTSLTISSVVLVGVITMFMMAMGVWARGEAWTDTDTQTRQAVRIMTDQLREAMQVTVDADGMGVTYRWPARDTAGSYVQPISPESFDRRIWLVNGTLWLRDKAGSQRVIAKNVLTSDPFATVSHDSLGSLANTNGPLPTAPAYKIFTPGIGSTVRSLSLKIVASRRGSTSDQVRNRRREVVYLRNIPQVSN